VILIIFMRSSIAKTEKEKYEKLRQQQLQEEKRI
jgi:hypothetical protein